MRPKSEIFTPKLDDEHCRPFHVGVPPGGIPHSRNYKENGWKLSAQRYLGSCGWKKHSLWFFDGRLECHRQIITNTFPLKRSQKWLHPKLVPILLRFCEVGNSINVIVGRLQSRPHLYSARFGALWKLSNLSALNNLGLSSCSGSSRLMYVRKTEARPGLLLPRIHYWNTLCRRSPWHDNRSVCFL